MKRGAIILCGGDSSRMGCDKAMLPFGPSEVMLARVVRLVGEALPAERIVCVASADGRLPKLPASVQIVHDPIPDCGPLAGLATGLAALEDRVDAVFACGCDAPRLVPALVTRLFELVGEKQIAAPHDDERLHPLAAVYRIDVLPTARSLLSVGTRSLMALLEHCQTLRIAAETLRDVDPELSSLATCNTPEDYHAALHTEGYSA